MISKIKPQTKHKEKWKNEKRKMISEIKNLKNNNKKRKTIIAMIIYKKTKQKNNMINRIKRMSGWKERDQEKSVWIQCYTIFKPLQQKYKKGKGDN